MSKIDPAQLAGQVHVAAKAVFTELLRARPTESFYVFGLWTDDSLQFLHPMANSEEALTQQVRYYQEKVDPKYGITSSDASLRWSYGDWSGDCDEGGHFDGINDQLSEFFDLMCDADEDDEESENAFMDEINVLINAIASGLKRLDMDGFFGAGAARDKITLMIVGDLAPDFVEATVRALNPPAVLERYQQREKIDHHKKRN